RVVSCMLHSAVAWMSFMAQRTIDGICGSSPSMIFFASSQAAIAASAICMNASAITSGDASLSRQVFKASIFAIALATGFWRLSTPLDASLDSRLISAAPASVPAATPATPSLPPHRPPPLPHSLPAPGALPPATSCAPGGAPPPGSPLLDRLRGLFRAALDHRGDEVHRFEVDAQVGQQRVGAARLELHVLAGVGRDVDLRLVLDVLVGGARVVAARGPADAASRGGRDAGADRLRLAILHVDLPVLLGVEEDLLGAALVLEAQLVEVVRCAADGRPALDAGLRAIRRQRVGRHLLGVVDAPGDDR